jgi:GT2 family glycosyltransferase
MKSVGPERSQQSEGVQRPEVSVVVATRGRHQLLPALIDSLASDPAVLEMIVVVDGVDAASVDELRAIQTKQPSLAFYNPSHIGHLAALDLGVAHASGEVVLLLDDDVLPEPMLATGHAHVHRQQKNLVVTGSMPVYLEEGVNAPVGTLIYAREHQGQMDQIQRGEIAVLDGLWAGNFSMRREDCQRIGLASTTFNLFYHSDRELGYRLAQAGLTGVYKPALRAVHLHHRGTAAFLRDARRQGAGRELLLSMYPDHPNPQVPSDPPSRLGHVASQGVRKVGATPLAQPVARLLMAAGSACGHVGGGEVEMAAAKIARRLMLRRGAVAGSQ